jgi:hypothetical protein
MSIQLLFLKFKMCIKLLITYFLRSKARGMKLTSCEQQKVNWWLTTTNLRNNTKVFFWCFPC